MDKGKLTAKSADSNVVTLSLKVNETLSILAGGVLQCKWLMVDSKDIRVESSGTVSADGSGNRPTQGIGGTSGTFIVIDNECFSEQDVLVMITTVTGINKIKFFIHCQRKKRVKSAML